MTAILLAYCRDNAELAEQLYRKLGRIGIPFQQVTNEPGAPAGQLADQLLASDAPALLILTDNFLKSQACMSGFFAAYQMLVRQGRVLTVVADGTSSTDGGHTIERVPTQFDRVGHAIRYMNYWQTAFLDLSSGYAGISPEAKPAFELNLDAVRGIANETGELFTALRENGYYNWQQLEADHFALFFRHFNLREWHEQYQKLAALDEEIPPIQVQTAASALAGTPTLAGPLAPMPSETQTPPPLNIEVPAFQGMNALMQQLDLAETAAQVATMEQASAKSVLERLIDTPEPAGEPEKEDAVEPMIQDAWFWLDKGFADRGLELLRLAIEQHPDNQRLQSEYQRALATQGQPATEQAVPETPPPPPPVETPVPDLAQEAASYDQMGDHALAKGDYLLAKYCWDRVTDLQPQYPGVYRKLALLTSDHLTDYKETAAHYLEEALAASPYEADLHYRLAMLLRDHLDAPEKAERHFQDTVTLQPGHAAAWLALADYALRAGNTAQAERLYRHVLQLDPDIHSAANDARFLPTPPVAPEPTLLAPPENAEPNLTTEAGAPPATATTPEADAPIQAPVSDSPERTTAEAPAAVPAFSVSINENIDAEILTEENEVISSLSEAAAAPSNGVVKKAGILTVLITGATSGIGRATAEEFARHGHRVMLTGRRHERLEALKQYFEESYHNEVLLLPFDVRDYAAVQATLNNLPEEWQNVDILINNAGLAKGLAPIHEGQLDHWETMIDTNIKGLLYVTRCIAPGMVRRRKGHIINISSSAGKEAYTNGSVYCATKFAVEALTRAMRLDLHTHNIRVSQVSPGHVEETEFAITRFDGDAEKAQIYKDFQPLRAADVAEAIYFIASRPPHVNIQDIWMFGTQQASATVINRSGREA